MSTQAAANLVEALTASSPSKSDRERRLAEVGLGIVLAVRESRMALDQACKDLFNLDTYQAGRHQRLSRRLVEFLEWGMELEDVIELAPEGLAESYDRMTALAGQVIGESLSGGRRRRTTKPRSRRPKA